SRAGGRTAKAGRELPGDLCQARGGGVSPSSCSALVASSGAVDRAAGRHHVGRAVAIEPPLPARQDLTRCYLACREHGRTAKKNAAFWRTKIQDNRQLAR